jgi:hypothetical protein
MLVRMSASVSLPYTRLRHRATRHCDGVAHLKPAQRLLALHEVVDLLAHREPVAPERVRPRTLRLHEWINVQAGRVRDACVAGDAGRTLERERDQAWCGREPCGLRAAGRVHRLREQHV